MTHNTKTYPNSAALPIILGADKKHFESRLEDVINWIADLGEKTAKKYGTDSRYYQQAEQARTDLANYHGLTEEIIERLIIDKDSAFAKGYQAALERIRQPETIKHRVKRKMYKLLKKRTTYEFTRIEQAKKEAKRRQTIIQAKKTQPQLY